MKSKAFRIFCLLSILCVLLASLYPLYMGIRVVGDMIRDGAVLAENYPKYIIPYTPISLSVLLGVWLMPILLVHIKKYAFPAASALSLITFFVSELLLESQVLITKTILVHSPVRLESWQMYMCAVYVPPEGSITQTWTAADVLIGEYSPAFKIHFYIISLVLIISLLNCFYGFGRMLLTGDQKRKKALITQSVASIAFLGMCILACFTAFYRTGELVVSPLSALLMSLFFILFGLTMGLFTGSFLIGKGKRLSVVLPSVVASLITLMMYMGELFLLSGSLYRLGTGLFFDGLGSLVFAPVDIAIILLSGLICAGILLLLNRPTAKAECSP